MTPPKPAKPPQDTSISATDIYLENALHSHGKDFQFGPLDPSVDGFASGKGSVYVNYTIPAVFVKQNDADDHAWKQLAFAS